LRNFARKDGPDLEQGDLVQIYRDSLTILRGKIGGNIQIQEQMPERAEAWCNPGQIGQVFVNLLQNAAQAMPEGGVLTIRIQALDEHWQVDIEDTGHGIPESVRDKVFDPFFTTRPIGEGVGLGLSMVFGIIQRHQGRIEALPKDPGTLFRIELPNSSSQK
ncbi:MAG: sensor histidine kinase, partial [Oceanobacter sp.]